MGRASIVLAAKMSELKRSVGPGGYTRPSSSAWLCTWYSPSSMASSFWMNVLTASAASGGPPAASASCARTLRIVMIALVTAFTVSRNCFRNANCASKSAGVTLDRGSSLSANVCVADLPPTVSRT